MESRYHNDDIWTSATKPLMGLWHTVYVAELAGRRQERCCESAAPNVPNRNNGCQSCAAHLEAFIEITWNALA